MNEKLRILGLLNSDTILFPQRINTLLDCRKPFHALAQMVACLPLVQQFWGSIPGTVVNFHLKIFNLEARRGGDVHFLIAKLYITGLD